MREMPNSHGFSRDRKDRFTVVLEDAITTAREDRGGSRDKSNLNGIGREIVEPVWSGGSTNGRNHAGSSEERGRR